MLPLLKKGTELLARGRYGSVTVTQKHYVLIAPNFWSVNFSLESALGFILPLQQKNKIERTVSLVFVWRGNKSLVLQWEGTIHSLRELFELVMITLQCLSFLSSPLSGYHLGYLFLTFFPICFCFVLFDLVEFWSKRCVSEEFLTIVCGCSLNKVYLWLEK